MNCLAVVTFLLHSSTTICDSSSTIISFNINSNKSE
uniref:Uncharacterized protein n=1 Tax=Anguilla anguilla TaxID=7936 RepID=A0A0E9V4P7_ANGAN